MRLHAVEHGHRLVQRLKLLIRVVSMVATRRREDAVLSAGVLRPPDVDWTQP